jgi:hypothetical protein
LFEIAPGFASLKGSPHVSKSYQRRSSQTGLV